MSVVGLAKRLAQSAWHAAPEQLKAPVWMLRYGAPPERQWLREVMNRDVAQILEKLGPERLDAVEVSGRLRGGLPWRSYTRLEYPQFDLCTARVEQPSFDVVMCEQVLEHVRDPFAAARTLHDLCRPGGYVLVSTPFLLRIHGHPDDYWRFSPLGLQTLLDGAGLKPLWVRSWGNAAVVKRNLGRWALYRRWRSLRNDPALPIVVWSLARRAA